MAKLRVGIILILVSWLPIAQVALVIAHDHHHLTSQHASDTFRLIIWGIQILIGFVGLWLAGRVAIKTAKQDGWKHTPANIWKLFWKS
ncbi:MAG TPA: hypothetical protein VLG27_03960 [Candidatus Saccharimonadia bacterium]|nr:hypothetical protein [Candidatus Saccharimonadia bacterium]